MLVLNVVRYSVIGLSLFFGTVNAMNVDNGKCVEIEKNSNFDIQKIVLIAEDEDDERLKELLTKAAGDDVLLKEIVDYLGSAESNSDEAHLVSSCMHYLREDVYAEFGHLSEKGIQWAKVNKLFGSIASLRNLCGNDYELSLLNVWKNYNGTAEPIVCTGITEQYYTF